MKKQGWGWPTHVLKATPDFFEELWLLKKCFEIRINDRDFQEMDILELHEWFPDSNHYSGRIVIGRASYVLREFVGLQPGYVGIALGEMHRATCIHHKKRLSYHELVSL